MAQIFCLNHPQREVAARCTSCGSVFCRECVTNFDGKMICSACYRKQAEAPAEVVKRDWFWLTWGLQLMTGLGLTWFMWWLLGRLLAGLPSSFHEGTMWERL